MHRFAAATIAAVLLLGMCEAISISWTGYAGNNQWNTATNWYPDQVPGPNDDVTIASGTVIVSVAAGVQSLTMGTQFNTPANLTIQHAFYIGSGNLYVSDNGNLFIANYPEEVVGVIEVDGSLEFNNGVASGQITVTSKGTSDWSAPGQKSLTGASIVVNGPLALGGLITLNTSSTLTATAAVTASGSLQITSQDSTGNLVDLSGASFTYSGPGQMNVMAPTNFGTVTLSGGSLVMYSNVQFGSSVNIPTGMTVQTQTPQAYVNMSNGVTGAGIVNAAGGNLTLGGLNMTGQLQCTGGDVHFASAASQVGTMALSGGNIYLTSDIFASTLNIVSGNLRGASTLKAKTASIKTNGFIFFDAKLEITGTATVSGKSGFAFGKHGNFMADSGSTLNVPAAASLTINGQVGAPGFTVNGNAAVAGTFASQTIAVKGSGTFNISGTVKVSTASFASSTVNLSGTGTLSGSNSPVDVMTVTGSPYVKATLGSYILKCPNECSDIDTSQTPTSNFQFKISSS